MTAGVDSSAPSALIERRYSKLTHCPALNFAAFRCPSLPLADSRGRNSPDRVLPFRPERSQVLGAPGGFPQARHVTVPREHQKRLGRGLSLRIETLIIKKELASCCSASHCFEVRGDVVARHLASA